MVPEVAGPGIGRVGTGPLRPPRFGPGRPRTGLLGPSSIAVPIHASGPGSVIETCSDPRGAIVMIAGRFPHSSIPPTVVPLGPGPAGRQFTPRRWGIPRGPYHESGGGVWCSKQGSSRKWATRSDMSGQGPAGPMLGRRRRRGAAGHVDTGSQFDRTSAMWINSASVWRKMAEWLFPQTSGKAITAGSDRASAAGSCRNQCIPRLRTRMAVHPCPAPGVPQTDAQHDWTLSAPPPNCKRATTNQGQARATATVRGALLHRGGDGW